MRLTIATVGSRGDVQPMLVVAETARRRGHEVVFCAPPDFSAWITSHGFEFHPLGDDIQAWLEANKAYLSGHPVRILRGMQAFIREQLAHQFDQLPGPAKGSDAIVFAGLAFAAPSVAELHGIPRLGVVYSTSIVPSNRHPPPMLPWQRLPRFLNAFAWWLSRVGMELALGGVVSAGRRRLGLGKSSAIRQVFMETPLTLAIDEGAFPLGHAIYGQPTRDGFLYYSDPRELDPDLAAWLDAGPPPVFIGFGSMSGHGTSRVEEMLTRALVGEHARVLVGAGWGGLGAGTLPAGWRVVGDVPHAKLFPRCAVVVHHGGSGTTASALRAGVPQVLLPLILDQFHHAHRLHEAGLVPAVTPMEKVTERQLVEAIRAAMRVPEAKRREVAERLRASDAGTSIVERVERMVADAKPAARLTAS